MIEEENGNDSASNAHDAVVYGSSASRSSHIDRICRKLSESDAKIEWLEKETSCFLPAIRRIGRSADMSCVAESFYFRQSYLSVARDFIILEGDAMNKY